MSKTTQTDKVTRSIAVGHGVFISVQNIGFGVMANPIAILPIMSDSKWPTAGHLYDKNSTLLSFADIF